MESKVIINTTVEYLYQAILNSLEGLAKPVGLEVALRMHFMCLLLIEEQEQREKFSGLMSDLMEKVEQLPEKES